MGQNVTGTNIRDVISICFHCALVRLTLFSITGAWFGWGAGNVACAQSMGVITGNGNATPAKPLPPGMKPPVVDYRDVAAQAGLKSVTVSGADRGKQYIVETTGTAVAIFDYD